MALRSRLSNELTWTDAHLILLCRLIRSYDVFDFYRCHCPKYQNRWVSWKAHRRLRHVLSTHGHLVWSHHQVCCQLCVAVPQSTCWLPITPAGLIRWEIWKNNCLCATLSYSMNELAMVWSKFRLDQVVFTSKRKITACTCWCSLVLLICTLAFSFRSPSAVSAWKFQLLL